MVGCSGPLAYGFPLKPTSRTTAPPAAARPRNPLTTFALKCLSLKAKQQRRDHDPADGDGQLPDEPEHLHSRGLDALVPPRWKRLRLAAQ
jgi:hypothetical protein